MGLFAIAVLVGYVGGRAFLAPTTSAPRPLVRPVPQASPAPVAPRIAPAQPRLAPPAPAPPPQREPEPEPEPSPPPAPRPAPAPSPPPQAAPPSGVVYRVQVGAFLKRENAAVRAEQLRQDGFNAYINQSGGLFKVQVGSFGDRDNATELAEQLRNRGYQVLILP